MKGIDTNLLVYAFDNAYPKKRNICKKIIEDCFSGKEELAVTNQILAEFSLIITKKIEKPLSSKEAKAILSSIVQSENWKVFNYTEHEVIGATGKERFWDSLIALTLKRNGVDTLLTENVKDFKEGGITINNPLG